VIRKDRSCRAQARRLIPEAIESGRAAGLDGKPLWRYVCRSFPWGTRRNWPYKIWRHEAAVQIGLKRLGVPRKSQPDAPGQGRLF